MLNHRKDRYCSQAKTGRPPEPKGTKSGCNGCSYIVSDGHMVPGPEMAPKTFIIIHDVEHGKPDMFLKR